MAIIGSDGRTTITVPSGSNANATAVDVPNSSTTTYSAFQNLPGSGYAISANFFLTAGHVVNGNSAARVTMAADVSSLPARGMESANVPSTAGTNPLNVSSITNFSTDLALLQTSSDIASDGLVLGLAVFYDHHDLRGLEMETAGFPIQGTPLIDGTGRTFMESSSDITATTQDNIRYTADTQGGQSGSGVWLDADDYAADSNLEIAGGLDLFVGTHVSGSSAQNNATRITPETYKIITDTMEAAAGSGAAAEAAALPVNVLMGGGIDGIGPVQSFVPEDNDIVGSYRREFIFGRSGDDTITGGGADDTIDGGLGADQVRYTEALPDYTITITNGADPDSPELTITHTGGSMSEGTDTIRNAEFAVFIEDSKEMFVPLLADEDETNKLRDGTNLTISQDVLDAQGDALGDFSVELPAYMFDGDIDYTLNLGAEANFQYNFAYIVDVSSSMRGANITQTKAAYAALTNNLIAQGVAAQSQFAVIPFNDSASLQSDLNAAGAAAAINALNTGGLTDFGPALITAESWFESLANVGTATNIAYFLSDGVGDGASTSLQTVAEGTSSEASVDVRAFGIGSEADLNSLNLIDSGNAVQLVNPLDLRDAFAVSGLDRGTIERIEVKLDGTLVDIIDPAALVDGALGLTYEGSIGGLDRSIAAENIVSFDVILHDGTLAASIESTVTTGQETILKRLADGVTDIVSLAVNAVAYLIEGISAIVSGNELGNEITATDGAHEIKGFGGNDRFLMQGGTAAIDGGAGIDTVVYDRTLAEAGGVTRTGGVITVGTGDTLTNVEFAQFADQRLELASLTVAPILSIDNDSIMITESAAGTMVAVFTLSLSSTAAEDVTVSFTTSDGSASAGYDYTASSGQVTFLAGETTRSVSIEILDDVLVEGPEGFAVDFSIADGPATFEAGAIIASASVEITDNDTSFDVILVNDDPRTSEGTGGSNDFEIVVHRSGDLSEPARVDFAVAAGTATALDFVGGLPSGSVAFAVGEDEAIITLPILTDSMVEADENFTIDIVLAEGNGNLDETIAISVLNDDGETILGTNGPDDLFNPFGGQSFILDGAADVVRGPVENFFGDLIEGFGLDDSMFFEGTEIARNAIDVTFGSAIFEVDTNGNNISNGQFTLDGDFSGGDFMALADAGNTLITYEEFLPVLQKGQALDPNLVNGIINQNFLKGDGSSDFQVTLQDMGFAGYNNVLGVYEIDASGNIVDTRIVFENTNASKSAVAGIADVEAGNSLGFFIVQNAANWAAALADGDTLSFVNGSGAAANISDGSAISIAVNGTSVDEMVFHSFSEDLNSDGVQHALSGVDVGGEAITVGFEDLTGGGDLDYEDVVFHVEVVDEFLFV